MTPLLIADQLYCKRWKGRDCCTTPTRLAASTSTNSWTFTCRQAPPLIESVLGLLSVSANNFAVVMLYYPCRTMTSTVSTATRTRISSSDWSKRRIRVGLGWQPMGLEFYGRKSKDRQNSNRRGGNRLYSTADQLQHSMLKQDQLRRSELQTGLVKEARRRLTGQCPIKKIQSSRKALLSSCIPIWHWQ